MIYLPWIPLPSWTHVKEIKYSDHPFARRLHLHSMSFEQELWEWNGLLSNYCTFSQLNYCLCSCTYMQMLGVATCGVSLFMECVVVAQNYKHWSSIMSLRANSLHRWWCIFLSNEDEGYSRHIFHYILLFGPDLITNWPFNFHAQVLNLRYLYC